MTITKLRLDQIRKDGGTQPRAALDFEAIEDYAEAMQAGLKFPPVVVFHDGENYWLADGFHRVQAARHAGLTEVDCDVRQGSLEDALWFSFSANRTNGLRRTAGDMKRAIEGALRHPKSQNLSDVQIANYIGCSHSWVSEIRARIFPERKDATRTVTRRGKTYQQNTANIGKRKRPPALTGRAPQGGVRPEETNAPDSLREGTDMEKLDASEAKATPEANSELAENPPAAVNDLFRAWDAATRSWDFLVAAWGLASETDRDAFCTPAVKNWTPAQPWLCWRLTKLRIDEIRRDGNTRGRLDAYDGVVAEYAANMQDGASFPPVQVCRDPEGNYWLWDGFYRVAAAEKIGWTEIDAEVRPGSKEHAQWLSFSANSKSGEPWTEQDKKAIVDRVKCILGMNCGSTSSGRRV